MSRKTQKAYRHVFKYIKEKVLDMDGHSITTDFELAMRNPLAELYPAVIFILCWFHFTQAAKKRAAQTPQLQPYIRQNEEAKEIYYKLLSLPLLPPHSILEQFKILKVVALGTKHRAVFEPFIKYYENQWMKKVCSSIFYYYTF